MAYKLTIADVIELPIKFTLNDAGKTSLHTFTLRAKRMTQDELRVALDDTERPTRDLLQDKVVGWRGQRLVVDEGDEGGGGDGKTAAPADFNAESFDCLLSLVGMEAIVLSAYLKGVVLADSQAEKAKN